MAKSKFIIAFFLLFISWELAFSQSVSKDRIKVGVFYFDGWTGKTNHLSDALTRNFSERKPIWGWVTSKQDIMEKQINYASAAGIDFFNFCWYYKPSDKGGLLSDPKNSALNLYLSAANRNKLNFSILVANHAGYQIESSDWEGLVGYWCTLFKKPSYVRVNDKPLITFFSMEGLIQTFGSATGVKQALVKLIEHSQKDGLKGVSLAICLSPDPKRVALAKSCGFEIITNYNYHKQGLSKSLKEVYPISNMRNADLKTWNTLKAQSDLIQIPTITLNWDPRPTEINKKNVSSRFEGYSATSVRKSIEMARGWILNNAGRTTQEKIVTVYAWNEYGEGSWLTPSNILGNSLLNGLSSGLRSNLR